MRIPLYIEFNNKNVLIIGGGGVGTGRAKKFLKAGANVLVLSLDFSDELKRLAKKGKISLIKANADSKILESLIAWSNLVTVAIGDLTINKKVKEIAKKHKVLINLANDAKNTEVVVPFEGEVDGIRFAVTTEGKSGIVARKVRDAFQKMLEEDEETLFFLKAMNHLKKYMKEKEVPLKFRMKLYFIVSSDPEFKRLVKEEKIDEARKLAEQIVEGYISGKRKFEGEPEISF